MTQHLCDITRTPPLNPPAARTNLWGMLGSQHMGERPSVRVTPSCRVSPRNPCWSQTKTSGHQDLGRGPWLPEAEGTQRGQVILGGVGILFWDSMSPHLKSFLFFSILRHRNPSCFQVSAAWRQSPLPKENLRWCKGMQSAIVMPRARWKHPCHSYESRKKNMYTSTSIQLTQLPTPPLVSIASRRQFSPLKKLVLPSRHQKQRLPILICDELRARIDLKFFP